MDMKQIHNWQEFKFDRNETTPPSGQSAFSEKENKILDGIGEFIESQIDSYPSNKFKHYDILQECILASLRHYKKKNRSYKRLTKEKRARGWDLPFSVGCWKGDNLQK